MGSKSIYFNPELNPLGKVPELENLPYKLKDSIENLTVPLKETNKLFTRSHY